MKYLPMIFVSLIMFLPTLVFSANLVPCDGVTIKCEACQVVSLANNVINWFIGTMMVVFAIIAVIAGFGLVTSGGNPEAKTAAKSKMTNAFIGLVIVLAAWLFVDSIMKSLVMGNGNILSTGQAGSIGSFGPWNTISCTGPVAVVPGTGGSTAPTAPTGSAARGQLTAAGIVVSKSECPAGVSYQNQLGGCTSVEGLNPTTLSKIIAMKTQCTSCANFTLTGGSELGHSGSGAGSHSGGDKFDLRTSDVQSYIMGADFVNGADPGGRQGRVNTKLGVVCVREGAGTPNDHWDCQ